MSDFLDMTNAEIMDFLWLRVMEMGETKQEAIEYLKKSCETKAGEKTARRLK